ncbi:MAG: hypothetical protein Q9186_007356, partial [Xanthomendoza sp. 1 TL-2023]
MSGIEAAGLVLGAIPVVIWALENYKTTREIWRRSRSKALLVDRMIDALREQRLLIELDIQVLLRAASWEDHEIAGLEDFSCYELLLDQELGAALQLHLGRAYEPYRGALARCERILTDIAQSVGGLTSRVPSQQAHKSYLVDLINTHSTSSGNTRWRETSQKFKFALKKDELDQKISELNASTLMLSRLRVAGGLIQDDTQHPTSSRSIEKLSNFLSKIQKHTRRLYFAIADGCSSSCHPLHRFKLYLEDRSAPLLKRKPAVYFRIESLPSPNHTELHTWHCAHVEALEEEQIRSKTEKGSQSQSEKVPTVKFDLIELDTPPKAEVQDLCAVLVEASNTNKLLKLYLTEHGKLSYHHAIHADMQSGTPSLPASTLTLDYIIRKAHESREFATTWSWKQRISLAYRLASSLLQFHSTPWLGGYWKKQSICFCYQNVADTPTSSNETWHFDADSPFIIHDFESCPVPLSTQQPSVKASLLDIGILLLEIWHLTPFEVYAAQEGLQLDNTFGARYEIASRWLNDTADNILPFYADPVCRCIEGTFASKATTLQWTDPQFQVSICEGLVKPLWDNCS